MYVIATLLSGRAALSGLRFHAVERRGVSSEAVRRVLINEVSGISPWKASFEGGVVVGYAVGAVAVVIAW